MADQYDVYKKLQELNSLLRQVNSAIPRTTLGSDYMREIGREMDDLLKKRHLLNAAGSTCPRCNGTGKV